MMTDYDHHTLQRLGVAPDGAEEWFCPTCGRRLLLSWQPDAAHVVLHEGDAGAFHSSYVPGFQVAPLAPLDAELVAADSPPPAAAPLAQHSGAAASSMASPADTFVDFGDPERTDGLAPWIDFLKRLDRGADA